MRKKRNSDGIIEQHVIASQNATWQFNKQDTEFSLDFSLDESVQDAIAKSVQYEAQNQQPTYEPNKPF